MWFTTVKKHNFLLPDHQPVENLMLVLVFTKGKQIKANLQLHLRQLIIITILAYKNAYQIFCFTALFSSDDLKHKTENKTFCRKPSTYPRLLQLESFRGRFQGNLEFVQILNLLIITWRQIYFGILRHHLSSKVT